MSFSLPTRIVLYSSTRRTTAAYATISCTRPPLTYIGVSTDQVSPIVAPLASLANAWDNIPALTNKPT